jgi:hypothetical protein
LEGIARETGASDNFIDGQLVEEMYTKILRYSEIVLLLLVSSLILGQEWLKTLACYS